ncbi:MAG: hypothetical protein NTW10_03290 [Bacteroidetes bacterium]|nr:hypothetical protein [Bacteroidota bacterium]
MFKKTLLIILMIFTVSNPCRAWVYPEHRDIMLLAIQKLDSAHRAQLDRIWAMARKGFENRLDESVADVAQGEKPAFIDYAAWPAIGGDHSTSAGNMVYNILQTNWILQVADVAARLKTGIAESTTRSEREGELRNSDLRLLKVDPEYVSRAGSNNVHFMLARPDVNTSAVDYFDTCFREGSALNLIGTYMWYHTSAMLKAGRLATETLTPEQRSSLALSLLADEAFGLHFLEDGFAAGHVAGTWGNAALRKGTHDYYDENGLEVTTWQGDRLVLTGDAYMRPQDADKASLTVLLSLIQLLDAAAGKTGPFLINDQPGMVSPDTFNIARANVMPPRTVDPFLEDMFDAILVTTPVPGLATGLGEFPRFRSELGPFIGIAPAARISVMAGGFSPDQQTAGVLPGLEVALHIGLGMDGVLNESGDGLVFLDLGWRLDGPSSIKIMHEKDYKYFGSILSAVPSRQAFYGRLRLPFYLIPGDILIVGPILYFAAPKTFNKMVATAGQGGVIPWQSGLITPIGRFQFILGREVGVCFYGSLQGPDAFLVPDDRGSSGLWSLISMRSTQLDFPFLEYRPVRTFSKRQSASFLLQLSVGVDIPGKITMIDPADIEPVKLKPIWSLGIRLGFDWRFYYAKRKS